MSLTIDKSTLIKYDIAGPRYTSYPTAPVWSKDVTQTDYIKKLKIFTMSEKTLSLYVHIPFCQSLCSFCACNVIIRKNDPKYADEYLLYLFKEIDMVAGTIGHKKRVKQLHWGGGTPNFLNTEQMTRLFKKIQEKFDIDFQGEVAIEIDPRTIDQEKINHLRQLGFNRVSMGIQDFSPIVQENINRRQPFGRVQKVYQWCRQMDFQSVNFDLIYGLPFQTRESFSETIDKVIALKPDRVALYSFAYVPWLKKHQTKIDPKNLPSNDTKIDLFLNSRERFEQGGYQAIAMDHFALKGDELAKAFNSGELYRNFMGYTVKPADEYIGLGLTSIGFIEGAYIQNHKVLSQYYQNLKEGKLPVERGKILSRDDSIRHWVINSLMCQFHIDKRRFHDLFHIEFDEYFYDEQAGIDDCARNDLIRVFPHRVEVTELGNIFIRNICMHFDYYLKQKNAHQRFSRTV